MNKSNTCDDRKKMFSQMVSDRIRSAMKELKLTQADILSISVSKGYGLQQSTLSKMLSGTCSNLSALNIAEVSNILGLDLNEVLSLDSDIKITLPKEVESNHRSELIRRADDPRMRGYLGSYHAYFFPTKSTENKLLKGTLTFKPSKDKSKCLAHFSFRTGKFYENNEPIFKEYDGELILSPIMSAAYCFLVNESIGEISSILFEYIPIVYEKLISRVALVLTSCAGDHRRPTTHRMILSTVELSDESLQLIQGQLYLNRGEILISEIGLDKFLQDERLDRSFIDYFCKEGQGTRFAGLSPIGYYRFDESVIRESFLDSKVIIDAINIMRQYSTGAKYNKIGSKSNDLVYRFVSDLPRPKEDRLTSKDQQSNEETLGNP